MDYNSTNTPVDLSDLSRYLFSKKKYYIYTVVASIIIFSAIAMVLPKVWTSDALVVSAKSGNNTSSTASMISSLAGINLAGEGGKPLDMVKRRVITKDFFRHLIKNEVFYRELIAVEAYDEQEKRNLYNSEVFNFKTSTWIKEPSFFDAYRVYRATVRAGYLDESTGSFLIIRADHKSPISAKLIVDEVVSQINELKKIEDIQDAEASLKFLNEELVKTNQISIKASINGLIENQMKIKTFANVKKDYLIKPLDRAYTPERRSAPKRSQFVLICTFVSVLLLTILLSAYKFYISNASR